MKRAGRARRAAILALVPDGIRPVIDVGADHGHVAHALGAIATERMPHRRGRPDVRWVVADGLRPFQRVGVAIVAGMGARLIARVLSEGPRPDVAVLHAQDDPPWLRRWLAEHGWRIEAERLAPEAGRFAEIVRAVPGEELATGARLELGPRLIEGEDPHLLPHLRQLRGYWAGIATRTADSAPDVAAMARARVAILDEELTRRG